MSRDELISRWEVIKCIKKWFPILGQNPDILGDSIISLPPIDPEHSSGSWRNVDGMYSCSECGSQFYDMSPYCPICGAKMKEFLLYGKQKDGSACQSIVCPDSGGVYNRIMRGEYSDE